MIHLAGDGPYSQQMIEAALFAEQYKVGNWRNCPEGPAPDQPHPKKESEVTQVPTATSPPPTQVPPPPTEVPPPLECESSYLPSLCIAPAWVIDDVDCWQIEEQLGMRDFPVRPPDTHGFDADGDGRGCEPFDP